MKCLIVAAGQGTRLRSEGEVKPLVPILGVPLIERVIRTAMEGGADEFYVVVGYKAEQVSSFLKRLGQSLDTVIHIIENAVWKKQNGVSVLQAQGVINEPFLLLMSDHIFDPSIIEKLLQKTTHDGDVLLAVDGNKKNPLIDDDDVTKVHIKDGCIVDIGKNIDYFNAFDTGIFLCTTAIFDALEYVSKVHGDVSLSAAVKHLAERKKAKTVSVNNFWIDVDDKTAHGKAEEALLSGLRGKNNDGPVARYLNRPISIWMSRKLANYNIYPNQISFFSFMCSLLAAGLFAIGHYWLLAIGGILAKFASIIDGCDGEIARLKYLSSDYGGWFDAVLDRYSDAFLLFGLTWHIYSQNFSHTVLIIGFLAIIGSFMLSYTADKYDNLMKNNINKGIRMGRDIRVLLISLGAVFNQPYFILVVVAVLMNVETLRRVIICRSDR